MLGPAARPDAPLVDEVFIEMHMQYDPRMDATLLPAWSHPDHTMWQAFVSRTTQHVAPAHCPLATL